MKVSIMSLQERKVEIRASQNVGRKRSSPRQRADLALCETPGRDPCSNLFPTFLIFEQRKRLKNFKGV